MTLAADPFEGVSRWGPVAAGALALFALWQLLSWQWSDAPGRALLEFDRTLLYVAALVLFGSLARAPSTPLRWIVRGVAAAIVVVGTRGAHHPGPARRLADARRHLRTSG